MKNTCKLVIVLAMMALTACDPGYTEDVVIRNASTHYVTIIPLRPVTPENYDPSATTAGKTYTLVPNEEIVIEQLGGIGSIAASSRSPSRMRITRRR